MNLAEFLSDGHFNNVRLTCCGKLFCKSCRDKYDKSLKESEKEWTCPMCRTPSAIIDKENFERVLAKAKEGKSWAEEWVGGCFYHGDGVTQNYKKAFEFYSRAAAQGEVLAINLVGSMYGNGEGVDQSYEQAFHFYSQASVRGLPSGQCNLGFVMLMEWVLKSQWREQLNGIAVLLTMKKVVFHLPKII